MSCLEFNTKDPFVQPAGVCQEPYETKSDETKSKNDRIQQIAENIGKPAHPLNAQEIHLRNRRVIEDEGSIEKKLEKTFQAAQERKDVVSDKLSACWMRAEPDEFKEEKKAQGWEMVGDTTIANYSRGDYLGISSTQGWKEQMEDFDLLSSFQLAVKDKPVQKVMLYGIFDGHNGDRCAKYLKDQIPGYLTKKLNAIVYPGLMSETAAIFNVLKCACVHLGEEMGAGGRGSRSTALIVLVVGDYLWVANVGDCRAILLDGDETIALSVDAKADDALFASGIEKRGGGVGTQTHDAVRVWPAGCAMARAVGYAEVGTGVNPRAKVIRYPLTSPHKKTLILASDGLWDFASTNQVATMVRKCQTDNPDILPVEMTDLLARKACRAAQIEADVNTESSGIKDYPQGDNLTVMVVDLPVPGVQVAGG